MADGLQESYSVERPEVSPFVVKIRVVKNLDDGAAGLTDEIAISVCRIEGGDSFVCAERVSIDVVRACPAVHDAAVAAVSWPGATGRPSSFRPAGHDPDVQLHLVLQRPVDHRPPGKVWQELAHGNVV